MPSFSAVLLVLGASSPQDAAPPAAKPSDVRRYPTSAQDSDAEFKALTFRQRAAQHDYDDLQIRIARGQTSQPLPKTPVVRLLPEFLALARKDSGGAQGWVVENLADLTEDREERLRLARELVPMLLARHAEEDSLLRAVEGLNRVWADFEEKELMEIARAIAEKTPIEETKAEAMLLQVTVHTRGGETTDAARLADSDEILKSILYTVPRTRAGKDAAGRLLGPLQKRFLEAERKWVDTLIAMQAQGKPPETWPKNPIHDFVPEYLPLASAAHHTAAQLVNRLHPAYEQAERQGIGFGSQWFVEATGDYFGDGLHGPWNALRADLLTVVYKQFPAEKWILPSLRKLGASAERMQVERLEPGLNAILEKNPDPRAKAYAYFDLAQSTKMHGDQKAYARAIELLTKVRKDFPDTDISQSAEEVRSQLTAAMPGAQAPNGEAFDTMGQSVRVERYRGRVLVLEFWSFGIPACLEAFPSRAALAKELAEKPFSYVGVNIDGMDAKSFAERAKEPGITWRNALASYESPITEGWELRIFPTTVLIDKKGIIQARNLPWEEMAALARKLVAEAD